jgi:hypothetical protein
MVIVITMNAECFDYQSNNSMMQTGTPGYRHTSMQANSWTQRKNEKSANTQVCKNTNKQKHNTNIQQHNHRSKQASSHTG